MDEIKSGDMEFEPRTTVNIKITFHGIESVYFLVYRLQCFGGTCCLHCHGRKTQNDKIKTDLKKIRYENTDSIYLNQPFFFPKRKGINFPVERPVAWQKLLCSTDIYPIELPLP